MVAALVGSLATLGAQKQLQRSTVFEWASLEAKPTQTGIRRDVMRAPTPTLDELRSRRSRRSGSCEQDA